MLLDGSPMHSECISRSFWTDFHCIPNGFPMHLGWIYNALRMDFQCILNGISIDAGWISMHPQSCSDDLSIG